jgi:RimJ/RimL family protein N-acetyltransferase
MASPTPPTLIALPDELHGPRVLLRPYRAEDAAAAFAAVEESREHLRPWVPWAESNATVEETRDYCIRCTANWLLRSDLTLGIFEAGGGRYLGGTGLHEPDWELRSFEIGYWLRATATGQGYATEAVSLLVDLAFAHLDARRIEIRCDTRNDASRRVAERAGFVLEGTLRNAALASDGRPADWLVFSRVPDDLDR